METCPEHHTIVEKLTEIRESVIRTEGSVDKLDSRINGAFDKMAVHVEDSTYWRRFIMGTAVSLVVAIIGGIAALASLSYNLGEYTKQIKVNTVRLDTLEGYHRTK